MKIVQVHLTQRGPNSVCHLKTWIPDSPAIKQGAVLELDKDPNDLWTVAEVYSKAESETVLFHRGWGLDLPKSQRTER